MHRVETRAEENRSQAALGGGALLTPTFLISYTFFAPSFCLHWVAGVRMGQEHEEGER